jgi:hypothetical protein
MQQRHLGPQERHGCKLETNFQIIFRAVTFFLVNYMHQLITRLEHQNAKFSERAPTSNSNSLHSNLERVIVIYTIYPKLYREKCGVDNL